MPLTGHRLTAAKNLAEREHGFLRQEIQQTKSSQNNFIILSIGATGFLIGIGLGRGIGEFSVLMLATAVFVLVVACIGFFDRVTTLIRIIGYYRFLELFLTGRYVPKWFPGWENALRWERQIGAQRRKEWLNDQGLPQPRKRGDTVRLFFRLRAHKRYRRFVFYTFAAAILVCWMLGGSILAYEILLVDGRLDYLNILSTIWLSISLAVGLIGLLRSRRKLDGLIRGGYNFEASYAFWEWLLVKNSEEKIKEYAESLYEQMGTA